jgi:AcrR family transcriptional regulator
VSASAGPGTAGETRERVGDAAAKVMETLGLARATTEQIASMAGWGFHLAMEIATQTWGGSQR